MSGESANARIHGTTKVKPCDRLISEKLQPFATFSPYHLALPAVRKADREGFVRFESVRYSVPPEHCGRRLVVACADRRVVVRLKDAIVAEHPLAERKGSTVVHPDHVVAMWRLTKEKLEHARKPLPSWRLTFDQSVQVRPLTSYEEARA